MPFLAEPNRSADEPFSQSWRCEGDKDDDEDKGPCGAHGIELGDSPEQAFANAQRAGELHLVNFHQGVGGIDFGPIGLTPEQQVGLAMGVLTLED